MKAFLISAKPGTYCTLHNFLHGEELTTIMRHLQQQIIYSFLLPEMTKYVKAVVLVQKNIQECA